MNVSECTIGALFDLSHTLAEGYLAQFCYPWEAVGGIGQFLRALICHLRGDKNFCERSPGVLVHRSAHIALSAELRAPCIVCADAEVRHGALLRGQVLVGRGCVVGNSVELKNSILFDGVHVPHFNYIGDSLLGYRSHFGAGAVTSNVKSDRSEVCVRVGERAFAMGGYKCGAFVGDGAEIGCNAVLCPGTVIGRNTTVYPLVLARGAYPANHIVKGCGTFPKR